MKFSPLSFSTMVALASLLCAPVAGFAQSILQSAGNFTLLGGTAVTNTGITSIIGGNVGSAAAVSGYNDSNNDYPGTPGIVTPPYEIYAPGTVAYIASPGTVTLALNDLTTAHNGLDNMVPGTLLTGDNLGALGFSLTPGVYADNDASAIFNGTLVLNAQGMSNVAFVIQLGTTLTISSGSTVTLQNPGSNDGIFFVSGTGAINVGNNVTLVGNYISGTALTLGTGDSLNGRALAFTGVTLAGAPTGPINAQNEPGGGDYTGGLVLNGTTVTASSIPEPAAFLWLAPLGVMGFTLWRRRSLRARPPATVVV